MAINPSGLVVDSNVWIGLTDPADSLHGQATKELARLPTPLSIITTNYTFAETVTVLSQRSGRTMAREFGRRFFQRVANQELRYVRVDAHLEDEAWQIFQATEGKNVSFVDCLVAAVACTTKNLDVFSFDKDLKQLGQRLGFKVIGV